MILKCLFQPKPFYESVQCLIKSPQSSDTQMSIANKKAQRLHTEFIDCGNKVRWNKGIQICIQNSKGVQLSHMMATDLEEEESNSKMKSH